MEGVSPKASFLGLKTSNVDLASQEAGSGVKRPLGKSGSKDATRGHEARAGAGSSAASSSAAVLSPCATAAGEAGAGASLTARPPGNRLVASQVSPAARQRTAVSLAPEPGR